jgi:hypothetical protein
MRAIGCDSEPVAVAARQTREQKYPTTRPAGFVSEADKRQLVFSSLNF